MTQIIFPGMNKRKRGLIINVSSSAIDKPTAMIALYGASKSSANCFSRALNYEYENRGITIQFSKNFWLNILFVYRLDIA